MAANRKFVLATNRGFVVFDTAISLHVPTKNINAAEEYPSLTKAIIARYTAAKDLQILEQDVRVLEILA